MTCFGLPVGVLAAVWIAIVWRLHAVIASVLHWTLLVMAWAGAIAIAAVALALGYGTARIAMWAGRKIRAAQAARGACLTCAQLCQEAQVTKPATPVKPVTVPAAPVMLPFPAAIPADYQDREKLAALN